MTRNLMLGLCLLGAAATSAQTEGYVDMGLSVVWSTENSGISAERPLGEYLTWTDAAQKYGAANESGRMASKSEWDELQNNCTWKWTTVNGIQGYLVTSKVKGFTDKSIFLPAAGWLQDGRIEQESTYASYWSATEGVQPGGTSAYGFNFQRGKMEWHSESRWSEQSVRLVRPLESRQVTKLSVNRKSLTMRQGTLDRLSVTMSGGRRNVNSACNWKSSDESVVSVSADGLLVARGRGECTITATAYGNSVACRVKVTADELEYVDLGLSVLWATRNLGAKNVGEYGYYYAWAETEPKDFFSWADYRYCSFPGQQNGLDKYVQEGMSHQYLPADNLKRLLPEDDAATLLLGADWHTPTEMEFQELEENCMIRDTMMADGVAGSLIISKVPGYEGKSIFVPFGGMYSGNEPISVGEEFHLWGADVSGYTGAYRFADMFKILHKNGHYRNGVDRFFGMNVRPVRSLTDKEFSSIAVRGDLTGLSYGEARQIDVVMEPSGRSILPMNIEWSVSDESMVQVMSSGKLIALATGECQLTASYMGHSVTVNVAVGMPVPQAVDLGLSVKWAGANLGAATPDDQGGMFSWGETSVKRRPYANNYKFLTDPNKNSFSKYDFGDNYSSGGALDMKEQLELEDDAAHVLLGGNWRMPTADECHELLTCCTWTMVESENRRGWLVTSNVPGYEGNSIFLPMTEYVGNHDYADMNITIPDALKRNSFTYRSSTKDVSLGRQETGNTYRLNGYPIRPVMEFAGQEKSDREAEIEHRNSSKVATDVKHEYVDLGLSVKWATMNVGATTPEEPGNSFAWGETVSKKYFTLYNYSLATLNEQNGYNHLEINQNPDSVLDLSHDAAHANWGGDWRLPTKYEFKELVENCEWADTIQNGVRGFLVTSRVPGFEGNSIFIPLDKSIFSDDSFVYYLSGSSSTNGIVGGRVAVLDLATFIFGTVDEFEGLYMQSDMSKIHIIPRNPYLKSLVRPVMGK